jgi:hypothetical protein
MPRGKRTAPAKLASSAPSTPPAAPLGSRPAGMDMPIPPNPRSTTDRIYQDWLDCVCIHGGGFVARATSALAEQTEAIPTIKTDRTIARMQVATEDGQTESLYIENVEGVGIAAPTREALDERRDGVLLGKAHEQEAIRRALGPLLDRLRPAGPTVDQASARFLVSSPRTADSAASHDEADEHRQPTIPPEHRTRPLGVAEAARLMGHGTGRQAGAILRRAMDASAVAYHRLTRQRYVFDRREFPAAAQPKLTPTGLKSS